MKETTIILAMLLVFAAGLYAQNIRDIPEYKEGLRYQNMARQAYDDGDYDKSIEYSAVAQENFQKAKDYADLMALAFAARNLRNRVQDRFRYAERINAHVDYPDEYAAAQADFQKANAAYDAQDYNTAIAGYRALLELASGLMPKVPEPAAELARADELRAVIAKYGFAEMQPTEALRGDTAYKQGKDLIGEDNAQAKLLLDDAIRYYRGVIDASVASIAANRRAELAQAKQRADSVNAEAIAPDSYNEARQKERSAESNLSAGSYDQAWNDSEDALAAYNKSYEIASSADAKPEYYTVRLIPHRRDCFWRIAGYDFVYGDPRRWRVLYEANKHLLPDPNNPRLMEPGMRIRIPAQDGEVRRGDYQPR